MAYLYVLYAFWIERTCTFYKAYLKLAAGNLYKWTLNLNMYVQYFVYSPFFAEEYSNGRGKPYSIVVSESWTFIPTFSSLDRSCLQNWSHATVQVKIKQKTKQKTAIRIPNIKKNYS